MVQSFIDSTLTDPCQQQYIWMEKESVAKTMQWGQLMQ